MSSIGAAAAERPHGTRGEAIKFELVQEHLILVPTLVNGHGPYSFILDTASDVTIVDPQVAADAGLRAQDSAVVRALTGAVRLLSCRTRVTLAGRQFDDTEVLIQSVSSVSRKAQGVLGWNVLSRFDFILDNARRQLVIPAVAADSGIGGGAVAYEEENGLPVIVTTIPALSQRRLRMAMDTGAAQLLLFSVAPPPEMSEADRHVLRTPLGDVEVCFLRVPTLGIGSSTLTDVQVGFMRPGLRNRSAGLDGLLPVRLFQAVYFDNSHRAVVLNPRFTRK